MPPRLREDWRYADELVRRSANSSRRGSFTRTETAKPFNTDIKIPSALERPVLSLSLSLFAKGYLYKEISKSPAARDLQTYLRQVHEKLHVNFRSQAIAST